MPETCNHTFLPYNNPSCAQLHVDLTEGESDKFLSSL